MQKLDLTGNLLSSLPDVAGPSSTLWRLWLGDNRFNAIPTLNKMGATIVQLFISSNLLQMINASSLANLPSIRLLDISTNDITTFPDLQPIGSTLLMLALHNNKIKIIPTDVLNSLQRLEKLYYSNSDTLNHMPDFSQSPSRHTLENLVLPGNAITNVPLHTLSALTAMTLVKLKANPLTTLPNLCHAPVVTFAISMPSNTLICDCHLRWIKLMESFGLSVQGELKRINYWFPARLPYQY